VYCKARFVAREKKKFTKDSPPGKEPSPSGVELLSIRKPKLVRADAFAGQH